MTQSTLMPLFKEQLENQSTAIGKQFEREKRGDWLVWWYFQEIEGFTPDEIEEVYCDGGGDLGIDAIWIDDSDVVHIYNFKNPEDPTKAFPATAVDQLISGLKLIFSGNYSSIAHEKLKERLEAIQQVLPKAYIVHLVSSGTGIPNEGSEKLNSFVAGIPSPTDGYFRWELVDLAVLQDRFYQQNLPAVENPITFTLDKQPYMIQSGGAACFLFTSSGDYLAGVYHIHGESLLHRNIRADQGDTSANRAIKATCTGPKSADFIHFNNGLTFLADEVSWDPFHNRLTLSRSQVVNGGQTLRILHRASKGGILRNDVRVAVRVIQSGGDKQFGSDVTVNQNNQNSMQTGFLRSNDPCVVQLATSLGSKGWYLERRKGELRSLTDQELKLIEQKIGHPLHGRVIRLKEGTQAYAATYFKHPELAKKNPKKMFQPGDEGGYFERIYSANISAEKMISAVRILTIVEEFVSQFNKLQNRKKKTGQPFDKEYRELLGDRLVDEFPGTIDQAIPQSAIFLCATIYQEWVDVFGNDPIPLAADQVSLADHLEQKAISVIVEHLEMIFEFAATNPKSMESSWPTMLKSNKFLSQVMAFVRGKRSKT